jgi:hypothetical protein
MLIDVGVRPLAGSVSVYSMNTECPEGKCLMASDSIMINR